MAYDDELNFLGGEDDQWLDDLKALLDDGDSSLGSSGKSGGYRSAAQAAGTSRTQHSPSAYQQCAQSQPAPQAYTPRGQSAYQPLHQPVRQPRQQSGGYAGYPQLPGSGQWQPASDFQIPQEQNAWMPDGGFPPANRYEQPEEKPRKKSYAGIIILSIIICLEAAAIAAVAIHWVQWMS